ncbi:MAG: hypothetical protein L7G91_03750 [Acidilobus sp.]|nr:hypothetical protein [Acidilobus sp.]MCG2889897.1 hypothetical protein [Acidilobus sp.]MCG2891282.1 hypothetical protein [Acidilobus sp.]
MSEQGEKVDISKMLSFIPPASAVYSRELKVTEKRVRLNYSPDVQEGSILLSKKLASELGIKDKVEVSVGGGRRRLTLIAVIDENSSDDTNVYANPDQMKTLGIADKSTVVVRAPR